MRLRAPKPEPAWPGENRYDARVRQQRNRDARREWEREASRICSECGYANINVRHNVAPEDQLEGPAYYATITDLHEFQP